MIGAAVQERNVAILTINLRFALLNNVDGSRLKPVN